jgi:CTP:phosphocholine cytidylyltransferase-like protein
MNGWNVTNQYIIDGDVYTAAQLTAGQKKAIEQAAAKEKYAVLRKNLTDQYGDKLPIIIQIYTDEIPHRFEAIDSTGRDLLQVLKRSWIPD